MQLVRLNRTKRLTNLVKIASCSGIIFNMALADGGYFGSDLASRERVRRQGLIEEADKHLMDGRSAYAKGDFETAVKNYQQALEKTPKGSLTEARLSEMNAHLVDGNVALAQQYKRLGKYDEARGLLESAIKTSPGNTLAQKELSYLDDPIRTNPALTFEHSQNVDKVRRGLYMGEGFYNLGQYDKAEAEFNNVLRVDPYNKAARRWLERCANIKADYYRSAYDETRARLLMEVDKAWEISVAPEDDVLAGLPNAGSQNNDAGGSYILNKLRSIVLPVVDFEDTTVEEAIDFLRLRSRELDDTIDPNNKGINFIIRNPNSGGSAAAPSLEDELLGGGGLGAPDTRSLRIKELKLRNVPLIVALKSIADLTKLRYKVDEYSVTLLPIDSNEANELITRTWKVTPTFLSDLGGDGGGDSGESDDPFAEEENSGGIKPQRSVQDLLQLSGVEFNEGATANYIASTSSLIVKNTINNLDLIDGIVAEINKKTPKQIRILTKFVEVSQENTDELSFDWSLGSGLDFIGNSSIIGGTLGNSRRSAGNFSNNPVTSGLRTGDFAISRNNIDFIVNNPARNALNINNNPAPSTFSIGGILGQGAFEMVVRALSQKKGTDVMTAPSITARSGENAKIEVIRELIYPTEYEPPEVPQAVNGGSGIFPVTPATPTAFETRNTGVTLEIVPTIGSNDFVIDLQFAPDIVEFEGFVNYGSPIQGAATDPDDADGVITITENRIEMPVFSSRRVKTALTIYDGYTVSVGGLMREDVQNVEDKVPILGDIPYLGRLFQSKSENRIKTNLIIFVTAQIIDATGQPIRGAQNNSEIDDLLSDNLLPPIN